MEERGAGVGVGAEAAPLVPGRREFQNSSFDHISLGGDDGGWVYDFDEVCLISIMLAEFLVFKWCSSINFSSRFSLFTLRFRLQQLGHLLLA
jgi:hypothetical protein